MKEATRQKTTARMSDLQTFKAGPKTAKYKDNPEPLT
jgi:hypothetical protein